MRRIFETGSWGLHVELSARVGLFLGYIAGLGHGLFMARAVVAAVRKRLMDAKRR
jgi:hypothetical protein